MDTVIIRTSHFQKNLGLNEELNRNPVITENDLETTNWNDNKLFIRLWFPS